MVYPGEILELGRSCVDPAYRQRPAMQLLWSGIAAYVSHYGIALMFGCASLPGTDPDALALPLSYLHHHHLAPLGLRPRALADRYVEMGRLDRQAIDRRRAVAALPPLIKGYLRLGGFVGDGAVIDEQFNTTDVCIVVKTDLVDREIFAPLRTAKQGAMDCMRHGLADAEAGASRALFRLDGAPDAGAGGRVGVAPPVDERRCRSFITAGAAGSSVSGSE